MQITYLKTAGEFEAVVSKPNYGWLGKSKVKETPFVQLQLTVDDASEESGQSISWYGYLSDKAIGGTMDKLVECFDFDGNLAGLSAGQQTFEGQRVRITVEEETYEGKAQYKVKWINSINRAPVKEDEGQTKMIVAMFQKKAIAAALEAKAKAGNPIKAAKAPTQKPTPAPIKSASNEDDVPF